jgi:hypothetical protein
MELDSYTQGCTSSPDTSELDKAMIAAMKEFTAVQQSGENKFARFKYETYTDLINATMPHLLKAGVRIAFFLCNRKGRESMVGKLKHPASGQWESSQVDLIYPVNAKTGEVQRDGQGAETADTYARKRLLRNLTACWVAGLEVEVERVHDEKNVQQMVDEADAKRKPKAKAKKDAGAPLVERIRTALQMVKGSPAAMKEKLAKAEQCCINGEITEEQLVALQNEFPLPEEVAQ